MWAVCIDFERRTVPYRTVWSVSTAAGESMSQADTSRTTTLVRAALLGEELMLVEPRSSVRFYRANEQTLTRSCLLGASGGRRIGACLMGE